MTLIFSNYKLPVSSRPTTRTLNQKVWKNIIDSPSICLSLIWATVFLKMKTILVNVSCFFFQIALDKNQVENMFTQLLTTHNL